MFLMIPIGLRAQLDPVSLALKAYTNKDLTKAKELIELAVQDETHSQRTKTWYFRGFIHKDLYKNAREEKRFKDAGAHRQTAIESFYKSIELDEKQELVSECNNTLRYLSNTLYNDAAYALDSNNFELADEYFEKHKSIQSKISPDSDFRPRQIEFSSYKASKYSALFEQVSNEQKEEISSKIIDLYKGVLDIDSNNISANYNLAIHYYNQGVNLIENMDYDVDFELIFEIQAQVMDLFGAALPYMHKAYKLNPYRKETLVGLSGIYFGLNDIEKSEYYQEELKKLESE